MSAVVRGAWAVVFGAAALTTAGAARRSMGGSLWLLVLLFAVAAVVLVVSACAAAWTETQATAYARRLRRTRSTACRCGFHAEEPLR